MMGKKQVNGQGDQASRGLQGLAGIKQVYAQGQAQRESERAQALVQAAQAKQRDADRDLFARAVGAVKPLPKPQAAVGLSVSVVGAVAGAVAAKPITQRFAHPAHPSLAKSGGFAPRLGLPDPWARQALGADGAAPLGELSDVFDPFEGLDLSEDGPNFCRPGVAPELAHRLRQGHWPERAHLDLHGLRSDEARVALAAFVARAHALGLRCVRVVHGKGLGSAGQSAVLQTKVRSWLVQIDVVMAFVQASADAGGAGAVWVLLRPA